MESLVKAIILSMLPISELRGGIPLALSSGVNIFIAFVLCVLANIIIIPFVFLFFDILHKYFLKIKIYRKVFNFYIERNRKKLEKHVGTKWEFFFIYALTAIPFPLTGAYSSTILSWFFGLKRKKAFLAISLGVITAGIIVTLVSVGFLSLI